MLRHRRWWLADESSGGLSEHVFPHGFCRGNFQVEYAAKFHRKTVGIFQYRIVSEQDVCAMTLYVSPFVLRHHQGVLAACKYPAHGLAV